MRLRVRDFAVLELCQAASKHRIARVEALLASGVDPNARFDDLDSALSGVEEDWASGDKNTRPPIFFEDESEEPPLYRATRHLGTSDKANITRLVNLLLEYGADPYALSRQRLRLHKKRSVFPGETVDDELEELEELDLFNGLFARWGIIEESRSSEFKRARLERGSNPEAYAVFDEVQFLSKPLHNNDYDIYIDYKDALPHPYGVRSVIHSLLVAGAFVQPIFDFLGDKLDVERRDPQGRTLFLAACLSKLGLDGPVNGTCTTVIDAGSGEEMSDNPFPQKDSPWRELECPSTTRCNGPSLLEFFVSRGSNLLAVDKYGRNAFHLLFDEENYVRERPAINDIAIKYLLKNCSSLINQPDKAGIYPLHMAIRWMGIAGLSGWDLTRAQEALYRVEIPVNELLSAGADPLTRDSRGNTVLHYLAASKLGEKNHYVGNEQKRLLRFLLAQGVDPMVRNADGRTALEIFLTTGNDDWVDIKELDDPEGYRVLGEEIIDTFLKAGYDIEERNAAGQTLLHVVATLVSERAAVWFKVLEARGLDPLSEDKEANSALNVAKQNGDIKRWIVEDRVECPKKE